MAMKPPLLGMLGSAISRLTSMISLKVPEILDQEYDLENEFQNLNTWGNFSGSLDFNKIASSPTPFEFKEEMDQDLEETPKKIPKKITCKLCSKLLSVRSMTYHLVHSKLHPNPTAVSDAVLKYKREQIAKYGRVTASKNWMELLEFELPKNVEIEVRAATIKGRQNQLNKVKNGRVTKAPPVVLPIHQYNLRPRRNKPNYI